MLRLILIVLLTFFISSCQTIKLHIKDCGNYNKASKMLEKLNIKTPQNKI